MSYMGGKAKCAEHILRVLNDPLFDEMDYVEPFIGYAHILRRVINKRSYKASDANELLITLLRAVQNGQTIPHISKHEYACLKKQKSNTLKRAVAAFTYSFNGKEWGGYTATYRGCASTAPRNPPDERRRYYKKLHENETFKKTDIFESSYHKLRPRNKLIYCDPPYASTAQYRLKFDHTYFWNVIRTWSRHNIVFVSEYSAPDDFVCVALLSKNMILPGANSRQSRMERVFMHHTCLPIIQKRARKIGITVPSIFTPR